jgi:hypothetical protein
VTLTDPTPVRTVGTVRVLDEYWCRSLVAVIAAAGRFVTIIAMFGHDALLVKRFEDKII